MKNEHQQHTAGSPLDYAEMASLINEGPSIFWICAPDARCTWLNKRWYEFTGQHENQALGFGWLDAVHPDDLSAAKDIFEKANTAQQPFELIYRLRDATGKYQWFIDKGSPRFDAEGTFLGMTGTLVDIQDQKSMVDASAEKLRRVVENAPFPIGVYIGKEMIIELANASILEVFGKGPEVIGKSYKDILPELGRQKVFDQLDHVYETGIPLHLENQYIEIINKDQSVTSYYFNYSLMPLFDANGVIYGIMNTAAAVTDLNLAKKAAEESEAKFRSLIEEAPVATCLFVGEEMVIEIANEKMLGLWGKGNTVIGKKLTDALPELIAQPFPEILSHVFKTGIPYETVGERAEIVIDGELRTFYFDFTYQPLFDAKGAVYGIMDMAVDVTEKVLLNQRIIESQQQLLSSFEEAPVGIAMLKKEQLTFTMANPFYAELVGRTTEDIIGKPLLQALPEIAGQGFDQILEEVIESGRAFIADEVSVKLLRDGKLETIYVDLVYRPQYNKDKTVFGVFVVATNVTQQVLSRKEVEASEAKLRSVIANAPAGIGLFVGRDLIVELPNKMFIDIVGKGPDISGKPLREVMPELLTEGQPFLKILDDVFTSGKMFQSDGSLVKIVQNGIMTYNYYNITYSPLFDEKGEVYAILDIAIDVTETVRSKQKSVEAEATLRGAVELAGLATWSLDIRTNIFKYSDKFVSWLGFTDDTKPSEEAYNPIPEAYRMQIEDAIKEAVKIGGSGVYNNEHPIINYTTGEQRIIHAQAQVFYDTSGNPEVLRGTAQDVTKERMLQQKLEFEVKKRTEELQEANAGLALANNNLQKNNAELAQFAYIASHDLQEPVRKINIFAKMLEDSLGEISGSSKNYLNKLNISAVRMMNLIRDVLAYSQLGKENITITAVDLNEIANGIISDFDLIIEQKNASIQFNELPVIEAIPLQMTQLFGNLISNSLKYSREHVAPKITITAMRLSEEEAVEHGIYDSGLYYKFEFKDNGIGFKQEYSDQIFNIFQRLHGKTEYDGTGIGLAICKKIAQNHNGDIFAKAAIDSGAVFTIVLPAQQPTKL